VVLFVTPDWLSPSEAVAWHQQLTSLHEPLRQMKTSICCADADEDKQQASMVKMHRFIFFSFAGA
jgi:hypothetical protein